MRPAQRPRRLIPLRRWLGAAVAASIAALALPPLTAPSLAAQQVTQRTLVSPVPAAFTPRINDGTVFAMAEVDGHIVVGGNFTNASSAADPGTVLPQAGALSFDETTGALDSTGFRPRIDGQVNTVVPGPGKHQVYVGGTFTKVNGKAMRLALLNVRTGHIVAGWNPPDFNLGINKVVLADGKLFVGGSFTSVGRGSHHGLVTLDPRTGRPTSYADLAFTGHHNYSRHCDPSQAMCANGHPGVRGLAVNPAGTKMIVTGDFINAGRASRDQVAMVDLHPYRAALDPRWATRAYTAACFSQSFDSYIRDVEFSPNGKYFVIASTGGIGRNTDGTYSSCDSAARFNTGDHGTNVRPQWISYSGEDSIWTVAITGTTVYVGGHQRWLNNRYGENVAGPGAVPRPGIAALNPKNGLPYSWNPGRNPRGAGCFALLATTSGLWIGSDTDYIGDHSYQRPKVAFFPLAGGEALPPDRIPRLPGRLFEVGATSPSAVDPGRLDYREFDGSAVGAPQSTSAGIDWSDVRGAFTVNGVLFYGKTDGNLYERAFDGTSAGAESLVAPYDDPAWDNVQTGSGQTYQGLPTTLAGEIPTISSMFFTSGRLYYTVTGVTTMFWRDFEPESGIVGSVEHSVGGRKDWSNVAGAFQTGTNLYYADQGSGELLSLAWRNGRASGQPRVVDAGTDWASRGLFLLGQKDAPTPTPTAAFDTTCTSAGRCTFSATPWVDPDGGIVRYAWSFGDGATRAFSTATKVTHRYLANGPHVVFLGVVDTAGAAAVASHEVTIDAPVRRIAFVGSSAMTSRHVTTSVRVPRAAKRADGMLLTVATSSRRAPLAPTGWRAIAATHHHGLTTAVFDRVATRHDLRSTVTVSAAKGAVSSVVLAVYRHTSRQLVERVASRVGVGLSHPTPALHRLTRGTWVVGAWSELARRRSKWHLPHAMTKRAQASAFHRPFTSLVLGDRGPVSGTFTAGPARATRRAVVATQWSIALSPALT